MRTKFFDFVQSTPASTWTINHNLGVKPTHDICIYEGGVLTKVYPVKAHHINNNTLVINFGSPKTGKVRLAGGEEGILLQGNVYPESI